MQYTNNASKHIQLRNNIYNFRYKIPARLHKYTPKKEIVKSLKTDSLTFAIEKVAFKVPIIHQLEYEKDPAVIDSLINSLSEFKLSPVVHFDKKTNTIEMQNTDQYLRISIAWDNWCKARNWSAKISKGMDNYKFFIIALWGDANVYDVCKKDIKDALDVYSKLPLGNKKPFNKWCIEEKVAYAQSSEVTSDVQSSKSVKGLLSVLQGFFSSYLTNEVDVLSRSPTLNVKYKYKELRGGSFTEKEMKALITLLDIEPYSPKKWGLLVAIYTGMRRSEVLKSLMSGVKKESETGIYYFDIQVGKTENSIRQVPVSEALISRGILNLGVIECNAKHLSLYVMNLMKRLDIPTLSVKNEKRTLHSLRHTFISTARKNKLINLSLLQEVVGHSKQGGLTDRYTHTFDLKDTKAVVEAIEY